MPPTRRLRKSLSKQQPIKKRRGARTASAENHKDYTTVEEVPSEDVPSVLFLELPREIRDLCYHHIWRRLLPFAMVHRESVFHVDYNTPPTSLPVFKRSYNGVKPHLTRRPELWFLASKTLLHEAMEQFQHGSTWTFLEEYRWDRTTKNEFRASARTLISPWKTHTLDLGCIIPERRAYLLGNDRDIGMKVELGRPNIAPLRYRGAGLIHFSNLRILRFKLILNWDPTDRQMGPKSPYEVNFQLLSSFNLPSLNVVHIIVGVSEGYRMSGRYVEKVVEAVKHEASVLVDNGGRGRWKVTRKPGWLTCRYSLSRA